jgi:hypothetical protein
LLNKADMKAYTKDPTIFAFVDSLKLSKVVIGAESDLFKMALKVMTGPASKVLVAHELLHTRSAAFSRDIHKTYDKPQPNGQLPAFSDGTRVRKVKEGLTERFTKEMLSINSTRADYDKESSWANKVVDIVGDDTAKKAYFSHDPAAMKQVKAAIDQLVVADKLQQRQETPRIALK